MFKYFFIFTIIIVFMTTLGCRQTVEINSTRTAGKIEIDGLGKDWTTDSFRYFDEERVTVGVCNDQSNLYLLVFSRDFHLINQLEKRGFYIWLNGDGKIKKNFGLKILGNKMTNPAESKIPDRNFNPDDREKIIQEIAEKKLSCVIIENKNSHPLIEDNSQYKIAKGTDKGFIFYEIKIPLNPGDANEPLVDLTEKNIVGIGLELGAFDKSDINKMRNISGDMMGGKGEHGGGMGGGRGGGNMGSAMHPTNSSLELWIRSKLILEE